MSIKKQTNNISMIQSQLGFARAKINRIRTLTPNQEAKVEEILHGMEYNADTLLGALKNMEREGGGHG